MFKFLRKYNKIILAVGGTLLMITFLVPFAIQNLAQSVAVGGTKWATIGPDEDKVAMKDRDLVLRELQLFERLRSLLPPPPFGSDKSPEHWYLLAREAEQAGFVAGPGSNSLPAGFPNVNESPVFVLTAFARREGVDRLLRLHAGSTRFSDRRLINRARQMLDAVEAQFVVIEAQSDDAEDLQFTDDELLAQMNAYGEDLPGAGERGFGYRLPDRLKLEWLKIPIESVRDLIEQSDEMSDLALLKHWRQNAARLPAQLADQTEIPQEVRDDLLNGLTTARMADIARTANTEARKWQRSAGLGSDGDYYRLTDDYEGISFEQLAGQLQQDYEIALPEYYAAGDWLWQGDLADLEGVSNASTTRFGATPIPLTTLVMSARELGDSGIVPIQQGIAGPPLTGIDGSVYMFRIVDTDPSRAPTNIDEVREAVVADLRRLTEYESLESRADAIGEQARTDGLLATALDFDTSVLRSIRVTQAGTRLPVIGDNETVSAEIVARAEAMAPDGDIADVDEADRIFVLEVSESLALLVVRIVGRQPMTQETFDSLLQGGFLERIVFDDDVRRRAEEAAEAFSYEALAERHNFKLARADLATSQPDEQSADDDTADGES